MLPPKFSAAEIGILYVLEVHEGNKKKTAKHFDLTLRRVQQVSRKYRQHLSTEEEKHSFAV